MQSLIIIIDKQKLEVAPKEKEFKSNWYDAPKEIKKLFSRGWRLPTKNELNQIRLQLYKKSIDKFTDGYYWSSSEINTYLAWQQCFENGFCVHYAKEDMIYVRAVRTTSNSTIKLALYNTELEAWHKEFPYLKSYIKKLVTS